MGLFTAGQVVSLPFPYSDLSGSKPRPVLLLASAARGDWIACQITSNPYADAQAIPLSSQEFIFGGLRHTSYLRPDKLFTAHESLIHRVLGILTPNALEDARSAVIAMIRENPDQNLSQE